MVTLFSAPNYCGEFDNAGAVMIVSKDLTCSFRILPVGIHYELLGFSLLLPVYRSFMDALNQLVMSCE